MLSDEIRYDNSAMEDAYNSLVNANTKLIQANEYYRSDKLSGTYLRDECERIMEEISQAITSAQQALQGIDDIGIDTENVLYVPNTDEEVCEVFDVNSVTQAKKLQKKLQAAGYDIGSWGIDGAIGNSTIGAINSWLENNGREPIKSKEEITSDIYNDIMNSNETCEHATIRRIYEVILALIAKYENDRENMTSKEIKMLCQYKLLLLGYYNNDTNDLDLAIAEFCRLNGIDASNINSANITDEFIDQLLASNLNATAGVIQGIRSDPNSFDPTNAYYITELQSHLKILGYYSGEINGKCDEATTIAIKQCLQDKGLAKSDMDANAYIRIMQSTKKGLELVEPIDGTDFLSTVERLKVEIAYHGFGYYGYHYNSNLENREEGMYLIDCSSAVTTYLYEYAMANGCPNVARLFVTSKHFGPGNYLEITENNGTISRYGTTTIEKFFEVKMDKTTLEAGDILVRTDGKHVEVYAGEMYNSDYAMVYNCGSADAVATPGATKGGEKLSQYVGLKVPSVEDMKLLEAALTEGAEEVDLKELTSESNVQKLTSESNTQKF